MKKQYGVANVGIKEYTEAASENSAGSHAVERPIIKFDGEWNPKIIAGEFSLPIAKETQEPMLEVAHRILGFVVTKDLLGHLPTNITGEHVGNLLPFYPFSIHKRFGLTYTDRVCPASTRTGRCPVCDGRMDLFKSDAYKNGAVAKDDIIKNGGFGDRQLALVVSRVFFNGEDMGIRAWTTLLTNEKAANARHDNFFDLVQQLSLQKKMMASETLPPDYYSNGDGARWLLCEYVRATYSEDDKKDAGDGKKKRAPGIYWKLSKVTPTKEICDVKASDVWWPEMEVAVEGAKKPTKVDGIELVDIYGLVNHTPIEELKKAAAEKVAALLNPRKRDERQDESREESAAAQQAVEQLDAPAWSDIVSMEVDELVRYGVAKGGVAKDLELTGAANIAALRRCVAGMWKVTPTPTTTRATTVDAPASIDDEPLPF